MSEEQQNIQYKNLQDSQKPPENPAAAWSSLEDYKAKKDLFIEDHKQQFIDFFNKKEEFRDLTNVQKIIGAKLMAHFIFGLHMAYTRFGLKYNNYNLKWETGEPKYKGIAYIQSEDCYGININEFKRIIGLILDKSLYMDGAGITGLKINPTDGTVIAGLKVAPTDFFELTGIEEAAHLIFYHEKGRNGREPVLSADSSIKYFTSEVEERALIWKIAYAKRYMPQYYDSLKDTLRKVREARIKAE